MNKVNFFNTEFQTAIVRNPIVVSAETPLRQAIARLGGTLSIANSLPGDVSPVVSPVVSPTVGSRVAYPSCVVVVSDDDRVIGILTERDVVRLSVQQLPLDQVSIQTVMTAPPITLRESAITDVFTLLHFLGQHGISHLPLVDDQGRLVGLITPESLRQITDPLDLWRWQPVSAVMAPKVVSAPPTCSMLTIAALMTQHQVSSVVIVTSAGGPDAPLPMPLGLVTERDLVRLQVDGMALDTTIVATVMSQPVITIAPDASLWEVQQCLEQHAIRRVVVTGSQGELVGIVTQSHLLHALNPWALYTLATTLGQQLSQSQQTEQVITHLQQTELALEDLKAELESNLQSKTEELDRFFSLTLELLCIANMEGYFLRLNPRWEVVLGYTIAELEGTRFLDYVHPDDLAATQATMAQLASGDRVVGFVNRYRCKDGSYRWIDWQSVPSGHLVYAAARDITDRILTEQQEHQRAERESLLREITQRIRQSLDLQTIFETACQEIRQVLRAERVGIFKLDPTTGYAEGEFLAEAIIPGVPTVVGVRVQDHCFGEKYAPLYAQGRYFAIADIYHPEVSPCHTDILAQFQVRANLIMPLLCGPDLWGLLCIHQCSHTRSWDPAEIDLSQQLANQLAIAIQQATLYEQLQRELRERQATQQQLTERNQQLAIFNEELARATRLKDEFLANMSHELRTPLNAILGMTEGLQEAIFGAVNDQQRNALKIVEGSATHLLELINDILDVAKVESGQIDLSLAPTAIAPLCESSVAFIKQQALKKRIAISVEIPKYLPDLMLDERRIRQVLINLLNNAVKFTPEGGQITLKVTYRRKTSPPILPPPLEGITRVRVYRTEMEQKLGLTIQTENSPVQHYIRFAIIDTGIGIPKEYLDKLFQPFVQIDSALNRQYAGTGLGLALVKRIVELHGGEVGVVSREGFGSCFTIDLPFQFLEPLPPISPRSPGTQDAAQDSTQDNLPDALLSTVTHQLETDETLAVPPSAPLILLAEDNPANVLTVVGYLEAKGYHLLVAENGAQAIAIAQAEHPNLILMDVQMPGMDGLEAIQTLRQCPHSAQIPIIALTALAMEGDRERCLAAGATDYLAKPVKLKELAQMIQQLLLKPDFQNGVGTFAADAGSVPFLG